MFVFEKLSEEIADALQPALDDLFRSRLIIFGLVMAFMIGLGCIIFASI